ncbi:WbqC family protein [Limnohabitans sp.]|uniref:WbqC family protein n=1 Tax=Limnohabitans sp. TaxID=1907725 RepID=UPI0031FCE9F9
MKKIAIVQSNYIPWKGYFDLIAAVDEFILYDDVQFTKNDWRNRNQIKTPNGLHWLSIPVGQNIRRLIRNVDISDHEWQAKHWKTLFANYSRAKAFEDIAKWLEPIYMIEQHSNLSALNRRLIEQICSYLEISTIIKNSWDYELGEGKTERLVNLCRQAGANIYISGPAAKSYLDESLFSDAGVQVAWFDYSGYSAYPQLWGDFIHGVSILDLLFNCGKDSKNHMQFGFRDGKPWNREIGGFV